MAKLLNAPATCRAHASWRAGREELISWAGEAVPEVLKGCDMPQQSSTTSEAELAWPVCQLLQRGRLRKPAHLNMDSMHSGIRRACSVLGSVGMRGSEWHQKKREVTEKSRCEEPNRCRADAGPCSTRLLSHSHAGQRWLKVRPVQHLHTTRPHGSFSVVASCAWNPCNGERKLHGKTRIAPFHVFGVPKK